MSQQNLPGYVASAVPNPFSKRVGWLTSTAASYAGVMLWFVFWQDVPTGGTAFKAGTLACGLQFAIVSLIIAAAICYLLFYKVPGMLGMKTGLPLYIVGTSTYGVKGGFFMPGFLMGLLQFGWLSVNAYFAGLLLAQSFGGAEGSTLHLAIGVVWAVFALFIGLNGIKYVGMLGSFMPIIPLFILGYLLYKTYGTVELFKEGLLAPTNTHTVNLYGLPNFGVLSLMCAYVVGFFATAGAAGCDFGMNNKNASAVKWGGLVGVFGVTVLTGVCALLIVAGIYGNPEYAQALEAKGNIVNPVALMNIVVGEKIGKIFMFLLVIAAFPSACFSTLIAANSFKTTLPKVNPYISCGLGVLAACALVITGLAGKAGDVFTVIGASFGPVCGSMVAEYIINKGRWAGPRAGFNPAGWLAWIFGFTVGSITLLAKMFGYELLFTIPCPPVSAFIVGFVLYLIFAALRCQSRVLDMPQRIDLDEPSNAAPNAMTGLDF